MASVSARLTNSDAVIFNLDAVVDTSNDNNGGNRYDFISTKFFGDFMIYLDWVYCI